MVHMFCLYIISVEATRVTIIIFHVYTPVEDPHCAGAKTVYCPKHYPSESSSHKLKTMAFGNIFGSSSASKEAAPLSTSTVSNKNAEIKKQLESQIAQELAIANATELVNKITENCFDKCIPRPGPVITAPENECTRQCMEKYMYAWNLISKAYITRVQQSNQ